MYCTVQERIPLLDVFIVTPYQALVCA